MLGNAHIVIGINNEMCNYYSHKGFFFFNYYDSITFYNDVFKRIPYGNFIYYKVYIPFFLFFYDVSHVFWKISKKEERNIANKMKKKRRRDGN